ncbi:MAG: purine-nucleoside phosphorylase [Sulfurimonas sp.]
MIICAGEIETFNFAAPVGIGLLDVSINLTKICIEKNPDFLLFIGSAGSYGRKGIFEIVESKTASNIENSFLDGSSYTPIDNVVSAAEDVSRETSETEDKLLSSVVFKPEQSSKAASESRETLVNCSNYITADSRYAKEYLKRNIDLENMEFYAVLKVAQRFGIPAGGVFVVTNYCDENAHRDFKKNHKEAMLKLTAYLNKKNKELRV